MLEHGNMLDSVGGGGGEHSNVKRKANDAEKDVGSGEGNGAETSGAKSPKLE